MVKSDNLVQNIGPDVCNKCVCGVYCVFVLCCGVIYVFVVLVVLFVIVVLVVLCCCCVGCIVLCWLFVLYLFFDYYGGMG